MSIDAVIIGSLRMLHVPDRNKRRVTGYGVYSNRALGERRKRVRRDEEGGGIGAAISAYEPETEADTFAKKRRQSWARLIQKIWEVNPMICKKRCQKRCQARYSAIVTGLR